MHNASIRKIFAMTMIFVLMSAQSGLACSWAAYSNGSAAVVARTMDWYHNDSAVVKGHGRNVAVKAASTANALQYKSKYASLQVYSFGGIVSDVMNEKGLQGSLLYLEGSTLPKAQPGRKDMNTTSFLTYAADNFATVKELLDSLSHINFIAMPFGNAKIASGEPIPTTSEQWPGHFAFADTTGDKAIIEFREGKLTVYHGQEHNAMTNEPAYEAHLYFDAIGNRPTATITPVDRRAKAKFYLADMLKRNVTDSSRALLGMRGVLSAVSAGTEELDPLDNEVYPTIWSALIDQKAKAYYIIHFNAWNAERYDFSLFSADKPEVVKLTPVSGLLPPIPYDTIHSQQK